MRPLERIGGFQRNGADHGMFLGYYEFVIRIDFEDVRHNLHCFFNAVLLNEPTRTFRKTDDQDEDDDGRGNLHGNRKTPCKGATGEADAVYEKVCDRNTKTGEQDLSVSGTWTVSISPSTTYFGCDEPTSNVRFAKFRLAISQIRRCYDCNFMNGKPTT